MRPLRTCATRAIALAGLLVMSAEARADELGAEESDALAPGGESASSKALDGSPPAPDVLPPPSKSSRKPTASPESSPEAASQDDLAGMQTAMETEPITAAIIAGVVLTAFGQAVAGTLVMTTMPPPVVQGPSSHGDGVREQGAPLEATAPLVGPFVALGRHGDLGVGYQAVLGIAGALQIVGLAAIVAGSAIQRPVEQPITVSIDGDPQGVRVGLVHSW